LEEVDGVLTCRKGGMELSQVIQRELEDIVLSPPRPGEPKAIRWGGRWHCPADGERMVEHDGIIRCPTCKRCLPGRVIYGLVEFHVHAKVGA
jgi:hypothetical protein